MVAELRLTEGGETTINEDKQCRENNLINENGTEENYIVTLHVHMMNDNTIAMPSWFGTLRKRVPLGSAVEALFVFSSQPQMDL
eukprot:4425835-Amphidinium_carterae.2